MRLLPVSLLLLHFMEENFERKDVFRITEEKENLEIRDLCWKYRINFRNVYYNRIALNYSESMLKKNKI